MAIGGWPGRPQAGDRWGASSTGVLPGVTHGVPADSCGGMNPQLDALLTTHGALRRADHRRLGGAIDVALRSGALAAPFRGVYTRPSPTLLQQASALMLADASAIVTDRCAAALMGWPSAHPAVLTAASRLPSRPGYALSQRAIPRRLVQVSGGVRLTSKALTAIDLVAVDGAAAIDDALRRGVTLEKLWDAYALTPHRRGRDGVRIALRNSRTTPWSPAERAAHAALAKLAGWVANHRVGLDEVTDAVLDIAFRSLRLGIEIDGWEFHSSSDAVRHDRERDWRLAGLGWQVVRFPAGWVMQHPDEFREAVAAIVRARAAQLA